MIPLLKALMVAEVVYLANPAIDALNEGARAIDENNIEKGLTLTQQALDSGLLGPYSLAKAHNNMCVSYYKLKLYRRAIDYCNLAIAAGTGDWRYFNNRGSAYWGLGESEKALADFRAALALDPSDDRVLRNMKMIVDELASGRRPAPPAERGA